MRVGLEGGPWGGRRGLLQLPIVSALLFLYASLFLPFIPNAEGYIGPDYSQFFPGLLSGYYWFLQNGLSEIPWFTPAACGGMPYFADPSVPFYALPQFLTFLVSPLHAVQYTFLLVALAGYVGMYRLLRGSFALTTSAATLGAVLFMFNGYYAARMLIGHLAFNAFPLIAIVAACILPPPARQMTVPAALVRIVIAALCLGYMVESGMFHTIPPATLGCIIVILLYTARFGWRLFPWFALAGACIGGVALSAGKISASVAFITLFPRDFYLLPGIADVGTLLTLAARALFFKVPDNAHEAITNATWLPGPHEWDYGMSPVPLVLFGLAMCVFVGRWALGRAHPTFSFAVFVAFVLMVLLLAIPLALNWYEPTWNAFLKSLPFFRSTSVMLRWLCAYLPIICVVAAITMELIGEVLPRYLAPIFALAAIVAFLGYEFTLDRSYYRPRDYRVTTIENGYAAARASRAVVPITQINRPDPAMLIGRNDKLADGMSEPLCYQPAFGYRLEKYPVKQLSVGPMLMRIGTVLNVKNPACYVFPAENGCTPGDHFVVEAWESAEAFLAYRPFPFVQPLYQRIATWISVCSLIGALAALLCALLLSGFAGLRGAIRR